MSGKSLEEFSKWLNKKERQKEEIEEYVRGLIEGTLAGIMLEINNLKRAIEKQKRRIEEIEEFVNELEYQLLIYRKIKNNKQPNLPNNL
jgi:glutamyl-tRNA reductase